MTVFFSNEDESYKRYLPHIIDTSLRRLTLNHIGRDRRCISPIVIFVNIPCRNFVFPEESETKQVILYRSKFYKNVIIDFSRLTLLTLIECDVKSLDVFEGCDIRVINCKYIRSGFYHHDN